MRVLVVRTAAGLCNRVWALLGGAAYAEATGRSYAFVWHPTHACGARFDTLWDSPYREIGSRTASVLARLAGTTPYSELTFDHPRRVLVVVAGKPLMPDHPQIRPPRDYFQSLQLVPQLEARVERAYEEGFAGRRRTVGVMIRANSSAHAVSRETSPPEWFYRRMDDIRADYPDVGFFLSTDSPEVSDEVHRRFADVAELPGKSEFNSATGVQDGVCDLYLLARTDYIIGAAGSSFSVTAGWLAGHGGFETPTHPPESDLHACLSRSRRSTGRLDRG